MSPRTGRPPKDEKKDTRLQIRVDQSLLEKLDYCTEKTGKTRSEIVREGVEIVFRREQVRDS